MTILYRILSFFINLFAFFIAFALFIIIPVSLAVPAMWLPVFLLVAIVLYAWFSTRFRVLVLMRRQTVKHSLRDWIRVNGFVAIAFSFLNILSTISLLRNPALFINAMQEMMNQFDNKLNNGITAENVNTLAVIMLIYFTGLFIHVLWTFALMKKHQEYFQQPQ
jgi:hypothetical protein